ncbi:diguanylate cyclase [uncultured Oscillibacter sp.]|uniref:GGDEF domain-containing response regulator n=1 Tax=uncultured Oscillibacter sp. TaxID=876091 RepID=UPI002621ED17|nr:diguanylate cyclase [uncultured Oscillibacter sp.]
MDKILIVDDSPVQANFLSSILSPDYEVTVVHTAEEGLGQAKAVEYSLILLDVIMPGMDGFQLLKMLQEEVILRHTPVILITSLNDIQNEERGLTLGAVDYITKPFHPAIVRARVHTHINLYKYRTQIEREATVDQLTGVPNRRRYDEVSVQRWQDAIRLGVPFSVCMFDIDKFKVYNDTFGHPAGDKVIKAVAETASSMLRRGTDFFARYGGEEFVALILGGGSENDFAHLCRVHQAVEELHIAHNPEVSPWVTISIGGISVLPKAESSFDTYLKMADAMLYDAKRFGRNQVVWTNERMEQRREK